MSINTSRVVVNTLKSYYGKQEESKWRRHEKLSQKARLADNGGHIIVVISHGTCLFTRMNGNKKKNRLKICVNL